MFNRIFREITPEALAKKQLNDAKLQLLEAEAHKEYYDSLCSMLNGRIERLSKNYIGPETNVSELELRPNV